jgi:DNA polymerase-4
MCKPGSGHCQVRKINGIGPKAEIKLHSFDLKTIGDIAARPRDWLIDNFGKSYGAWMHDAAWGRDNRPVVTESEPVSMSRETTFDRDLHASARPHRVGRDLHPPVRATGG